MVYLKITDRYDITSPVYRGHKAIMKQTEETMKQILFLVCLKLNVPVNNFSVKLERSHRFLGITSTFGGKCLAQGHNTATRVGLEPPTSGSGVRGVNHQTTATPIDIVVPPLIITLEV